MENGKYVFRTVLVVSLAIVGMFAVTSYRDYQKTAIEAEKAVQVEELATERAIECEQIEQAQKTERTEERSQFWQKIVPWGEDEQEENNNDPDGTSN